jgi:hypothetical protein
MVCTPVIVLVRKANEYVLLEDVRSCAHHGSWVKAMLRSWSACGKRVNAITRVVS